MGGEDKAEGVDAGAQGPRKKYKAPSGAQAMSKGLDKRVSWEGRYFIGLLKAEEPTYWDPRPGWAVKARPCVVHYQMQGPKPPSMRIWMPPCCLHPRPVKKGARNKSNPPCCERAIEKVAGASLHGFPCPQRGTMGLTGVTAGQLEGESKRTRMGTSVHVDKRKDKRDNRKRQYLHPVSSWLAYW